MPGCRRSGTGQSWEAASKYLAHRIYSSCEQAVRIDDELGWQYAVWHWDSNATLLVARLCQIDDPAIRVLLQRVVKLQATYDAATIRRAHAEEEQDAQELEQGLLSFVS